MSKNYNFKFFYNFTFLQKMENNTKEIIRISKNEIILEVI